MRSKEQIKKIIVGTLSSLVALDSWYLTRKSYNKEQLKESQEVNLLKDELEKSKSQINKLLDELSDEKIQKSALEGQITSLSDNKTFLESTYNKLIELEKQSRLPDLNENQKSEILRQISKEDFELKRLVKESLNEQGILTKKLEFLKKLTPSENEDSNNAKVNTNLIDNVDNNNEQFSLDDVNQSSILGSFFELRESAREELSQFSSEQLCCLTNAIGFLFLLVIIFSISTIIFGEYLIKYFKLEERFPKLAKYLKIRQSFSKFYVISYVVLLYIVTIFFVCVNLFMFFTY